MSADHRPCDLVLKGGVSSGLVYAATIQRLKDRYRFRGLAGASAGAIAAAFAAAAEYARARGDNGGFERLERRASELVTRLKALFVPSAPFRALLKATIHLAPGSGKANYGAALWCFAPTLLLGSGIATVTMACVYLLMGIEVWLWAAPALILAAVSGAMIAVVVHFAWAVIVAATRFNFGICDGRDLTQWLHAALQDIAGKAGVLTFGDLAANGVDLRMVASHISLARPVFLPDTGLPLWFDPEAWQRLFPDEVMAHLGQGQSAGLWRLPDDMPVIVALRMSLACPGLFEQVPVYVSPDDAGQPERRLYIGDGGLTVNFPFDIFAASGVPTIAIDLETLAAHEDKRCWAIAEEAGWPVRYTPLPGPLAFCWSLFRNMREGQNRAASRLPGANLHVFRIGLKATDGGMNLNMTPAQIATLMGHGDTAGTYILDAMEDR